MVGFYCAPSAFGNSMHETQTAGMSPQKAPEQEHEIPDETCGKPHSEIDEEVYYHLVESYNHPGQWRWVEEDKALPPGSDSEAACEPQNA